MRVPTFPSSRRPVSVLTLGVSLVATLAIAGCGGSADNGSRTVSGTAGTAGAAGPIQAKALGLASNYYVSPTGDDHANGSLTQPWKTLQHALDQAQPGSTIYARAGVYAEQIHFTRSGAANAPITLAAYGGEHPVIDGATLHPANNAPGGLVNIADVSHVRLQGFEIRNFTSTTASWVPSGIAVSGAGSQIELINNFVHDIRTTVQNESGNAFGISVYGTRAPAALDNVVIDGNEIARLQTGSSESLSINGNVQHFAVTNNRIHDNNNIGIDAIGFENTAPDARYDQARDGIISGNIVYNISSHTNPAYHGDYSADGIYVDGGTRIIIERNVVHHVDIGIELASEHRNHVSSQVTVRSNLVYRNNVTGLSMGGAGSGNGGTDSCAVVNNTFYLNDTQNSGTGELALQNHVSNTQIANNIFIASQQAQYLSGATQTATTNSLNANIYFAPQDALPGNWTWNGKNYDSLAALQHGSNQELKGRVADPHLANPSGGNFLLASPSPAINAGLMLGVTVLGTQDLAGMPRTQNNAVDIGAYQH